MTDQKRRIEDKLPAEPLAWDTDRKLIDAALQHLADEKAAACLVQIPDSVPQLHVAIGTKDALRGLLRDDAAATLAAPVAAATEQATDELSDEEKAALERLDKPEWRAASHLKLRAVLAVEVARTIRMGAKIENLQDELRVTEGYRRGYADGTADAARIADVQGESRSIWDEAPVQGEDVLVTDGETVTAARWFSTGWAEHGFNNDEVKYLPEGRVTHWKPLPAASIGSAPLATPADAGAGLVEPDNLPRWIDNQKGLDPNTDALIEYIIKQGAEITRLSTSGAQVEAWEYSFIHSSALGRGDGEIGPCLTYDKAQAFGTGCIKQKRVFVGSPAPVTAEPVAMEKAIIARVQAAICDANNGADIYMASMIAASRIMGDIAPAPADRDAIRDQALPLYTCKGKGGTYELIGVAYGAGTSRGHTVNLYREAATGALYYRAPRDFEDRMQRIDTAQPSASPTGIDQQSQEGGEHA